ncbi:MAG: hypothetical protein ACJ757_10815 [Gaiellaceae bacterium]
MSVHQPQPMRGAALLLVHCSPVADGRESAYTRLERKLGSELTRLLVFALSGAQGRRGSSSP